MCMEKLHNQESTCDMNTEPLTFLSPDYWQFSGCFALF